MSRDKVWVDFETGLIHTPGVPDQPLGKQLQQRYNESTGKYDTVGRTQLEIRQQLMERRNKIMRRQLLSTWQCLQCKRTCRGDGSASSDGLNIPVRIKRYRLTEAQSDAPLRLHLAGLPEDLLEDKPELLFCGKCQGPVVMVRDAGNWQTAPETPPRAQQ